MSRRSSFTELFALCFALGGVACHEDSTLVSARGLVSASTDSRIEGPGGTFVNVPAGSSATDFTIVITALPARRPPTGTALVATPLRLGPSGTTFSHAVEIELPIDLATLPAGKKIDDIIVYRTGQSSSVFVPLPTRRLGPSSVAVVTEHFSDFVPVVANADGGSVAACGDQVCGADETCAVCPFDCGLCLPSGECGNGPCELGCGFGCTTAQTVLDAAHRLEWQRDVDPGMLTQAQAVAYCDGLALGSWPAGSWHLPTHLEIASLIDPTRTNPSIDATIFTNVPSFTNITMDQFWTSTPADPFGSGTGWTSHLAGTGFLWNVSVGTLAYALCVHTLVPTSGMLVDNLDATVTDTRTALTWQQVADANLHNAIDASGLCANLVLGGLPAGSWRAPNMIELLGITDTTLANPAIDPMAFPNTKFDVDYVSTTLAPGGTFWSVDFRSGGAQPGSGFTSQHYVRCVR